MIGLLAIPAALGCLYELVIQARESNERRESYWEAVKEALKRNKPLLVVGGPYGFGRSWGPIHHGFGDVCLDITAGACQDGAEVVQGDVREIPYPDGYFGAAYCSHVLEHLSTVEDAQRAMQELLRVADVVFLCYPSRASILGNVWPGHHLWIEVEGNKVYAEQR